MYPVFLHLANQPVLIVGGGAVALRKARGLLEAQASITVISPAFAPEFADLPDVVRQMGLYVSSDVTAPAGKRWRLIFAATNQPSVNRQIAHDAQSCGISCCRCDSPEEGDFSSPSVWRKENITVAVATGGTSPVVAARIREELTRHVDPALIELCRLMEQWRPTVIADIADPMVRSTLLRRLAGEEMLHTLRTVGLAAAQQLFQQYLAQATGPRAKAGEKILSDR